jgi:hypothetical protein
MEINDSLSILSQRMTWCKALIYTSSFSYLGAVIVTIGGYPPVTNISPWFQTLFYLSAFLTLLASFKYPQIKWFFAAFYGLSAMWSFSGLMSWGYYFGDTNITGPAMAAWDLSLAMALLLDK